MNTGTRARPALLTSCSLAVFACAIAQAQPPAPIVFLNGGYEDLCAAVAHDPDSGSGIVVTGSRAPIPPIEICTLAIRDSSNRANRAASHVNRGVLHFAAGAIDAALADFDAAVGLDAAMAQAYVNRGYIYIQREQWTEALADFDRAIALDAEPGSGRTPELGDSRMLDSVPEIARAHFSRGIAHEELGHVREAYSDYRRAAELAPEWPEPARELERFDVIRR